MFSRSLRASFLLASLASLGLAASCGDDSAATTTGAGGGGGQGGGGGVGASPFPDPDPLPALAEVKLTTERTQTYPSEVAGVATSHDVRDPAVVADLLSQGYGEIGFGAGEPVTTRTLDDADPPAPGPNAHLVTRFVHLSDTQLADDESPARLVALDTARGATSGAFRPQEGHECRILNAAVRTINKLNEAYPLEMVILGGDNADNAQSNEVDWFTSILDGNKRVECDSGIDDDPTPGPANDPKDPFFAEGLKVPWKWVTGNHDVLNQGNFTVDFKTDEYLSDFAGAGSRDWSLPGGPVTKKLIPDDPRRAGLFPVDLLTKVSKAGDGHGIDGAVIDYGKAFYTFELGETVRVIVLDTSAAHSGGADGLMLREDLEGFVIPQLQQAQIDGKAVILTSHHSSRALRDGDVFGGQVQPSAVLEEEFQAVVGGFDNVIMHLAGHTHIHRVTKNLPVDGHAYWEAESAALADMPHQMRMIEIHDMDNGFYVIRLIALDFATDDDPVAKEGKSIGVVDYAAGWAADARGTADSRNVDLWVPIGP